METVDVGERPHQEGTTVHDLEPIMGAVPTSTETPGPGMIESTQPNVTADEPVEAAIAPEGRICQDRPSQELPTGQETSTGAEPVGNEDDDVEDPDVYTIQDIIAHRRNKYSTRFKVLWENYPASEATWEEEWNFVNDRGRQMLEAYKKRKGIETGYQVTAAPDGPSPSRDPPMESADPSPANRSRLQGRKSTRVATRPASRRIPPARRARTARVVIDEDDDSEGGGV